MNVLLTGIINKSYTELASRIINDFCYENNIILIGDKSQIDKYLFDANRNNIIVYDYKKFMFSKSIEPYNSINYIDLDIILKDQIIRDSFIRLFPHYWDEKKLNLFLLKLSNFWTLHMIDNKIDVLINLAAVPHFPNELVIEKLALFMNTKILNFWYSGVENYIHLAGSVFNNVLNIKDLNLSQIMSNNDYDNFLTAIKEIQRTKNISITTPKHKTTKKFITLRDRFQHIEFHKGNFGYIRTLYRILINKYLLQFDYLKKINMIKSSNLPAKFIYFPLHYQPEATSLPLAGIYRNQELIIDFLNKHYPYIKVVLKEHPVQSNFGRTKEFYKSIKSNDKLVVIDDSLFSSQYLIENSEFVVSATGTVLFESFILNKNGIMFGNNIYRLLPNIVHIDDFKISILDSMDIRIKEKQSSSQNEYFDFMRRFGLRTELLLKSITVEESELNSTYLQLRTILEHINP